MTDNTITRAYLAEAIFRKLGFSLAECSDLVDKVFEEMGKALENGQNIKISSFGAFRLRDKKPRMGRNPKTKQEVPISPRRVVTFHASHVLTEKMNGSSGGNGTNS